MGEFGANGSLVTGELMRLPFSPKCLNLFLDFFKRLWSKFTFFKFLSIEPLADYNFRFTSSSKLPLDLHYWPPACQSDHRSRFPLFSHVRTMKKARQSR